MEDGDNAKGETTEEEEDTSEGTEDRLSDHLDSMDFIDCDGEEETELTSWPPHVASKQRSAELTQHLISYAIYLIYLSHYSGVRK